MSDPNEVYDMDYLETATSNGAAPRRYLTAAQILAADDIATEDIFVGPWGGWLRVRALTGGQRAAWQQASVIGKGKNQEINYQETTVRLVALSVVDESGKPIFSDADIRALKRKSSAALELVSEVATRLSGIGDQEMDDLTKNSKATDSDDSA